MGMSASQCRLLSLTARLSDLEYQAQAVSNEKIRLSEQSTEANQKYENALDKEKLTVLSQNSSTYVDATAANLSTYASEANSKQKILENSSGQIMVSEDVTEAYEKSGGQGGSFETFLNLLGYTQDTSKTSSTAVSVTTTTNGATSTSSVKVKYDSTAVTYYTNIYNMMGNNGYGTISNSNLNDSEWLYDELSSGNLYVTEQTSTDSDDDGTNDWEKISYSTGDSALQTASDTSYIAKAEAEYNTETARIQTKDKRYDMTLKDIDTQHTAIQTEVDSVKKVIDKNIERSFKTFDA
jgi:hypothetical protein